MALALDAQLPQPRVTTLVTTVAALIPCSLQNVTRFNNRIRASRAAVRQLRSTRGNVNSAGKFAPIFQIGANFPVGIAVINNEEVGCGFFHLNFHPLAGTVKLPLSLMPRWHLP